jgi:outer membrane receptor for ferrienterochelin and colicin
MKNILLSLVCASVVLCAEDNANLLNLSLEELLNVSVTTTSKYAEKISDSPANIYVYTDEQIRERGYRSVGDLLKALPGVDVQNFSRFSPPQVIAVRGIKENNKFLILQDGIRISSPAGESIPISQNFPLYYAKQVEVLMGPAAVSYGADAFAGVINIITRNPDEFGGEVSISGGSDDYGYAHALIGGRLENGWRLQAGLHGFQSQKYDFAENFPQYYPSGGVSPTGKPFEFPQEEAKSFFFKVSSPALAWNFGVNYSEIETGTYNSSLSSVSAFNTDNTEITKLTEAYGKYTKDLSDDFHSTTTINASNYTMDNQTNFQNTFTGYEKSYKYASTDRVSIIQDFLLNIGTNHRLSFGAVWDWIDSIPVGNDLPSPYDTSKGVGEQGYIYPNTTLPITMYRNKHENLGGYLQDNWELSSQWRVVGGIRYDDDSQYGSSMSPRLSVIYKHDEQNLFKLLYSHAFLAPAPDLAFRTFGGFDGTTDGSGNYISYFFRAPNPDLKSEKLQTLEATYDHWFESNIHLKISPYYSHIRDAIVFVYDTPAQQFIHGALIYNTQSTTNDGIIDIYGCDLGLEHENSFGDFEVKSWGYVSYVDGSFKESTGTSDLPAVSKYKLKAGTTFNYQNKYLVTPQMYWIAAATNDEKNSVGKRDSADAYCIFDVHAEAKLFSSLSIVGDIYNLTDKKYTNSIYQGSGLATPQAAQPGRMISAGLRYRF